MTLKQENGNRSVTHKYRIKQWKCYRHVNRQLACYYMSKEGCHQQLGATRKGNPTSPMNGDSIVGMEKYDLNNIKFCLAQPIIERNDDCSDELIFPHIPIVSLTPNPEVFHKLVEKCIKWFEWPGPKNCATDYSIQCAYEWGPRNLIPKGFEQVTEGEVQLGDYIWQSKHHSNFDYWGKVNTASSAFVHPGTPIERRGIIFNHRNGKSTKFDYYEPFVIRRKQQN